MKREIINYYDELAPSYEADRFGGSYGRFIDHQERHVLSRWLPAGEILELACGTGRLSSFATVATDASCNSIAIASARRMNTRFVACDAEQLPFPTGHFSAAFAFHLLMHLDPEAVSRVLAEMSRVLKPAGSVVLDILSPRRKRGRNAEHEWHAATALSLSQLAAMANKAGLHVRESRGILLLPVHRLPDRMRMPLVGLDMWLARVMPTLASYQIVRLVKDRS